MWSNTPNYCIEPSSLIRRSVPHARRGHRRAGIATAEAAMQPRIDAAVRSACLQGNAAVVRLAGEACPGEGRAPPSTICLRARGKNLDADLPRHNGVGITNGSTLQASGIIPGARNLDFSGRRPEEHLMTYRLAHRHGVAWPRHPRPYCEPAMTMGAAGESAISSSGITLARAAKPWSQKLHRTASPAYPGNYS
jgi:hypothetical protein